MTFLALGDSYTIGEAVSPEERWPVQLVSRLREQGLELANPRIIARTGWTTDELNAAIDRAVISGSYDLVSLSIGVNNQFRGRPVADFESEFRQLLNRAIDFAGGRPDRVLVLSIPDWSRTPFATTLDRDLDHEGDAMAAYNRVVHEVATEVGVFHVDITPDSLNVASHPEWVASDGLHPSSAFYSRWVELILAADPPLFSDLRD